ncbi:hypothetical protein PHJA_000109600 [Phtheirospermum japonicum]|uniref:Uncharacterized protein n=1 Tax=Phtheirospermum japonicum TaxID=374723 RepID=A0A830BC83_9LAMI|nr:hypothetical protein PHJA_000109600 [Phtheirospermum japonicum]
MTISSNSGASRRRAHPTPRPIICSPTASFCHTSSRSKRAPAVITRCRGRPAGRAASAARTIRWCHRAATAPTAAAAARGPARASRPLRFLGGDFRRTGCLRERKGMLFVLDIGLFWVLRCTGPRRGGS